MSSGGRPKDTETQKIYDALHDRFPKFGRVQMCMIRNPEYGLQMASEAVNVLRAKGISPPGKKKAQNVKQRPQRKKENKITLRLNNDQKVRLIELKEQSGCKSVQEYMEKRLLEEING